MSNRLSLTGTKFTDVPGGDEWFGYRLVDDCVMTYGNHLDSVPTADLDLLEVAFKSGETERGAIVNHVIDSEKGMIINNTYYDHEELVSLVEKWQFE